MTSDSEQEGGGNTGSAESAVEQFLRAVEDKTTNPVHHRLLKVCRQANPSPRTRAPLRYGIAAAGGCTESRYLVTA